MHHLAGLQGGGCLALLLHLSAPLLISRQQISRTSAR
jgi:hypothetical protein